jgi:hypothetical protein
MTLWMIVLGSIILLFGFVVLFGAPYVPSQRRYVRRAFAQLYPLSGSDVLVDIGAGDGVVLREARRTGARAIGYEINPLLCVLARLLSRGDEGVQVNLQNFWTARLPDETTVIYAFSVKRDGARLAKKVQREAIRLGRPLALLCLGSPLPDRPVDATFEAYYLYYFKPA